MAVLLHLLRVILLPFVIAGVLAFLLTPLIDKLAARIRWPRTLIALGILALLLILLGAGVAMGLPELARGLVRLSSDVRGTAEQLLQPFMGAHTLTFAGHTLDAAQLADHGVSMATHWLSSSTVIRDLLLGGVGALVAAGMTLVILAYALVDGPKLVAGALWIVPPRHRTFVRGVGKRLAPLLRRYFIGVALVVLYAMVAAYVGLGLVLRLKGALLLAIATGALEMLPVVGPFCSALIAGVAALQQAKSGSSIIGYAVYALALRISIDQFFSPLVLGTAARVRPVLVIFGFLVSGLLFGVTGVILAVPTLLAVRVILENLYGEGDASPPV